MRGQNADLGHVYSKLYGMCVMYVYLSPLYSSNELKFWHSNYVRRSISTAPGGACSDANCWRSKRKR